MPGPARPSAGTAPPSGSALASRQTLPTSEADYPLAQRGRRCRRCEDGAHGRYAPPQPRTTAWGAADTVQARDSQGDAARARSAARRGRHRHRPGLDTLQAAMHRAGERHNMTRFTPLRPAPTLGVTTLPLLTTPPTPTHTPPPAALTIH